MASQLLPRSSIGGRVSSPFYFIKYVMYFDRPDQKQYTLQIKNKEGENVCVVEYLQAPMIEYSNFTQHDASDEIKILLRLKNFIEKHIKIEGDSIERTEAKRESISQYIIDKLDWSRIIDHIKATYFKERKSIYEGKDPYLFMEPPTVRGNGSFGYDIHMVCEAYNITPKEMMSEYTIEQYGYMMDYIAFSNFEQTEDGRRFNKSVLSKPEDILEQRRKIRESFYGDKK